MQVTPPSVILPTPALPTPSPGPEASPSPSPDQNPTPQPSPPPQFTPPTAASLNLPSAQPAGGNPSFAPASVGLPSMRLDDSAGTPGALGDFFSWAKKLRFQAALRAGYDDNVNSANGTNAIASTFANLNGGVNYRFGTPRLNGSLDLTGGVTRYFNSKITQPLQGTVGLGLELDFRFSPRLVFTLNSSSSYQEQPNITLIGTANNSNSSYYYTANSISGAYQWSDLFTSVTRLDLTESYYPENNNSQGFADTGFTQSIRYLFKPTTTLVLDYNVDQYTYQNSSYNSFGQYVDFGFDHTFNPKWFWNFRLGAQTQSSQNSASYIGPYLDSNFSWVFGRASSINWVFHYGTQPNGNSSGSYSIAARTGLNYTQGLFTKMRFDAGLYYVLNTYNDTLVVTTNSLGQPILSSENYNQTNIQGNVDLTYKLNRIIDLSIGYQYITQNSSTLSYQNYNRGITYLQIRGGF